MDPALLHWIKVPNFVWQLIYYLGGKDKNGEFYTAKEWYLKYGVGYCFKALDNDLDIVKTQRDTGYDLDGSQPPILERKNIKTPWYNDWDRTRST